MKTSIIAALLCVILSCIPITIPKDALNVLYGIVGVLFSVGMSLIIAFTAKDIVNNELKRLLRKSMHQVRNNFLWIFFISTFFYVSFSIIGTKSCFSIHIFETESYELTLHFQYLHLFWEYYSIPQLLWFQIIWIFKDFMKI